MTLETKLGDNLPAYKPRIQSEQYLGLKMQITQRVSQIMDLHVHERFSELEGHIVEWMRSLYAGRTDRAKNGGRLRDAMVYLGLKMCGVDEITPDNIAVIAAGELYNMASYYQNWHLDNKKQVKNEKEKKMCHIASHYFRELSQKLVLITNFSDNIKLQLLQEISESNEAIQKGQAFELSELTLENKAHYTADNIAPAYKKRCGLLSGRFYACSFAMAPIMVGKGGHMIELFKEIGTYVGTGGQMVNDVGDFCLNEGVAKTPDKDYQDQFADLEKGTLTLPVYELSRLMPLECYAGRKLIFPEKRALLRQMVSGRCFDSTRKITNSYRNIIERKIHDLQPSEYRTMMLIALNNFFSSNKFYKNLRDEHGYKWGKS